MNAYKYLELTSHLHMYIVEHSLEFALLPFIVLLVVSISYDIKNRRIPLLIRVATVVMFFISAFTEYSLLLFSILLIVGAAYDARSYRIPNIISVAIVVLFPISVFMSGMEILWAQHLFIFAVVLASGFFLFAKKYAGAGDVKFLSAISLWTGEYNIGVFLLSTAIAGGLLSLTLAGFAYIRKHKTGSEISISQIPIPYGVAIAAGGFFTLVFWLWGKTAPLCCFGEQPINVIW